MYTLYGMTGSCSMAVHVLLNELNQPYKIIDVRVAEGESRPEDFLKANPRGSVPVLIEGGHAIREGGAIISYLLDKHHSPMMPKTGFERAHALEWLMFANATMHPAYSRLFFLMGAVQDAAVKEQLLNVAIEKINVLWADVNEQLGKTTFVCGKTISAADILLTVIANWAQANFGSKIMLGEHTKRMIKNVIARPSYQQALAAEKVEYKAVA